MSWAALLGVEHWFNRAGLTSDAISVWLDHLWAWSTIGPDTFDDWYNGRPDLIEVGMGDALPEDLRAPAQEAGIAPEALHEAIIATTEVVYGNLFASITWAWVTKEFDRVAHVLASYELGMPSPDCLPVSTRDEQNGWGNRLSIEALGHVRATDWAQGC